MDRLTTARHRVEVIGVVVAVKLSAAVDAVETLFGRVGESDAFLDEHPQAHKPINAAFADAADLTWWRCRVLRQVANVNGN